MIHRRATVAVGAMSVFGLFSGRARANPESNFWSWFQANDAVLFDFERDQERTFDRLASELRKVDPNLTFEFGPKTDGRREFVISADGTRNSFPKVESLFAAAPTMPRWKVIKFRPRREPFDLQYSGILVKASTVTATIRPEGQKAGITLFIPGYSESAHKAYTGIAFLFIDQALGEYDVETRVGRINVQAPSTSAEGAFPLEKLPAAFDALFARH